jgi:hypothetical protein
MPREWRSTITASAGPAAIVFVLLLGSLVGSGRAGLAVPLATTERVSIGTSGEQGNDMAGRFAGPAINADGSVVAFDSAASTLVPGDTNGDADRLRPRSKHQYARPRERPQ